MAILITRPQPAADQTAQNWRALGMEVVVAPLFEIKTISSVNKPDITNHSLIFTSANGVRAFAQLWSAPERQPVLATPIYCVGEATADAARLIGFSNIEIGADDAESLTEKILASASTLPLIHFHGHHHAYNITHALTQAGRMAASYVLYKAESVKALPAEARDFFNLHSAGIISFFSPRAAETFGNLVNALDINSQLQSFNALCLSEATASHLNPKLWRSIDTAKMPSMDAMTETLLTTLRSA